MLSQTNPNTVNILIQVQKYNNCLHTFEDVNNDFLNAYCRGVLLLYLYCANDLINYLLANML